MKDHAKAMVRAAFAADALALGAHWIYDTAVIKDAFGRVESFQSPLPDSFHAGRRKGDFTHYGDQMLVLLESAAGGDGFDLERFARRWRRLFDDYDGYRDHATRETLQHFEDGAAPEHAGSGSTDLGGASRIAPLGYVYADDPAAFIAAARAQTAMTHSADAVVDSAAFFAAVAMRALGGEAPAAAAEAVLNADFDRDPFNQWVARGMDSRDTPTADAIKAFGQMCDVSAAFPGVIHLLARYPDDLEAALVENVMAGGDSSARGMIAGMILGASLGEDAIPPSWIAGMNARARIDALFA